MIKIFKNKRPVSDVDILSAVGGSAWNKDSIIGGHYDRL